MDPMMSIMMMVTLASAAAKGLFWLTVWICVVNATLNLRKIAKNR